MTSTSIHHFLPLDFKGPGAYKALAVIGDSYTGIAWPAVDHTQEAQHFHAQLVLNRAPESEERQTLGCLIQEAIERELDADVAFNEAAYSIDYVQPEPGRNFDYLNGRVIDVDRVLLDDPEQRADDELEGILADAPPVMNSYMDWQKMNAFRVHPTFALFSVLLFIQAFIGRNVRLPRDLRINLWMLLFAPSESGKGAAINLAEAALKQLGDKKIFAAVPNFTNRFGSPEGMLWQLSKVQQVVWTNEEMVKVLISLTSAQPGTAQYNMATLLMELHDAATKAYMAPIQYSGHDKRSKEMPPLVHPFFAAIGQGVIGNIGNLNAASTVDGLLNRFLMFVVEGLPPIGRCQPVTALPDKVTKWGAAIQAKKFVEFFNPDAPPSTGEPHVLEVYPQFENDWKRENQYGAEQAQDLPGIWGRYAEKVLQVAMLYALTDSMNITPEGFAWAVRLVRWSVTTFARKFECEGGGAADVTGKVRNALLAFFKKDKAAYILKQKGYLPSGFIAQNCRPWKDHPRERAVVVKALVEDGLIQEIPLDNDGKGYRLL
ncbi:hypothetical protein SAMN04489798_2296 [Pseudomonas arsenicoxydans]|uniref:DUF3987 domain-containing protein n=1 Tax=Pseudomonas arsenicoxydans TaxID=702115 RepID=A0A1H0HKK9_9PSED|nr:hypothetical protein [Pseudomonas arsenicoxydans]SDO19728.1 hypothetical protein SAMN04489798_2296 [Pseudomonas arsenicoxydans]